MLFGGGSFDGLADHIQSQVFQFFEADARFACIEFFARFGPFFDKPVGVVAVHIGAHHVDGHVVFLRGQTHVWQRLFGVAMISGGIDAMGYVVADHAVGHALFVVFVEVGENDFAHSFYRREAVFGEGLKILLYRGSFALHIDMNLSQLETQKSRTGGCGLLRQTCRNLGFEVTLGKFWAGFECLAPVDTGFVLLALRFESVAKV